jgi:hypothetical protein
MTSSDITFFIIDGVIIALVIHVVRLLSKIERNTRK